MPIKVTDEQAQAMYKEHIASLKKNQGQAAVNRFKARFPTADVYIDWLDYNKAHQPAPQHKRLNLSQIEKASNA